MKKKQRTPRKKPAQRRSKETVRAILVAAARILERDGYEKTNVNQVAKLAGVSVGSLYQYFPSKEALVIEVASDLTTRMLDTFQDGLADLAFVPMRDAIVGAVRRAIRAFRIAPRLREVILREMPRTLMDTSEFDTMLHQALIGYFEFHRAGIRPTNLDLAVAILRTSVEAAAVATASRGDDEEEAIAEISELVWRYVSTH